MRTLIGLGLSLRKSRLLSDILTSPPKPTKYKHIFRADKSIVEITHHRCCYPEDSLPDLDKSVNKNIPKNKKINKV